MKNKHMIRALKKMAEAQCVEGEYAYIEKFDRPRFSPEDGWTTGTVAYGKVNRGRGVKKAFKKWGLQGAFSYIAAFKKPVEAGVGEGIIN